MRENAHIQCPSPKQFRTGVVNKTQAKARLSRDTFAMKLNLAGKDSQLIPKFAGKAASPPIPVTSKVQFTTRENRNVPKSGTPSGDTKGVGDALQGKS